jgi:hypothetical protein
MQGILLSGGILIAANLSRPPVSGVMPRADRDAECDHLSLRSSLNGPATK